MNDEELENLVENMDVEQLKGLLVAMAFKGIANEKITKLIIDTIKKRMVLINGRNNATTQ